MKFIGRFDEKKEERKTRIRKWLIRSSYNLLGGLSESETRERDARDFTLPKYSNKQEKSHTGDCEYIDQFLFWEGMRKIIYIWIITSTCTHDQTEENDYCNTRGECSGTAVVAICRCPRRSSNRLQPPRLSIYRPFFCVLGSVFFPKTPLDPNSYTCRICK